mgnify:CR=1 FL=1
MTDTQFYNVMFITGVSQVLALLFCWLGTHLRNISAAARECCLVCWLILSMFLPYLDTGVDVPNLKESDLAEKIQSIVDSALPKNFAQNPILRTLEVPGETFAGGDQQGNMAIISVGCTYKGVGLGEMVFSK